MPGQKAVFLTKNYAFLNNKLSYLKAVRLRFLQVNIRELASGVPHWYGG